MTFEDNSEAANFKDTLSDSELRRRLLQRGLQPHQVELLVEHREEERAHRRIVEELGL